MRFILVFVFLALTGCGDGSDHPHGGALIADGYLRLSIDGVSGFVLDLVNPRSHFINEDEPVGIDVTFYFHGKRMCSFDVYMQSVQKNNYIITLDSPLYQEAACQALERTFLLQMTDNRIGILTGI